MQRSIETPSAALGMAYGWFRGLGVLFQSSCHDFMIVNSRIRSVMAAEGLTKFMCLRKR